MGKYSSRVVGGAVKIDPKGRYCVLIARTLLEEARSMLFKWGVQWSFEDTPHTYRNVYMLFAWKDEWAAALLENVALASADYLVCKHGAVAIEALFRIGGTQALREEAYKADTSYPFAPNMNP